MGQAEHKFHSDAEFVVYDRERRHIWGAVFLWGFLVPYILMYLIVNPIGTYYYTRLPSNGSKEKGVKGGALATVILGWLGLPFLNLYSPVACVAQT